MRYVALRRANTVLLRRLRQRLGQRHLPAQRRNVGDFGRETERRSGAGGSRRRDIQEVIWFSSSNNIPVPVGVPVNSMSSWTASAPNRSFGGN